MRILFIVNSPDAKFPVDIAQNLADKSELDIKVVPLLPAQTGQRTLLAKINFCLKAPFLISKIRRAVREYQPDIIHTHFWLSDIIGEKAARPFPHIKLVSTQHDEVKPGKIITYLKRRALKRFNNITAISKSVRQFLKTQFDVPTERITLIYNGTTIDTFVRGSKNDAAWRPTIGLIARLEPIKGGDIFMEAFCRLAIRNATVRAVIVGDGSQRRKLELRCRKANISDRVRFWGFQEDLIPALREIDIVVVPSRSEGLSVTILEALAAQKLVIASDIGGVPELIANQQTGLLVPPGNIQKLTEAMQWCIDHPEQALATRARGHQWLMQSRPSFDLNETIKKYFTLYASLLS
jgi:glycosyltransferase involved in cell wall biosynthesis